MPSLKLASCMAENTESFCAAVAVYLGEALGISIQYVSRISWQERERLFDAGEIQILWLCGFPYVQKPIVRTRRLSYSRCRFLPARVISAGRFIFPTTNRARIRATTRAYLAEFGQNESFFGESLESGAHTASLEMILRGAVDGAAIDSTVLEWLLAESDKIAERIRVIDTLGPSPIPPWVISPTVSEPLRRDLRALLLDMEQNPRGASILTRGRIERFTESLDSDYDPIRRMAKAAERIAF